jgi:hypothetical protein
MLLLLWLWWKEKMLQEYVEEMVVVVFEVLVIVVMGMLVVVELDIAPDSLVLILTGHL